MQKLIGWWTNLAAKVNNIPPPVALEELDPMEQCRRMYQELAVARFAGYRVRDGQGQAISVVYKTIDEYIAKLHQHTQIIKNQGAVLPPLCEFESKIITLNQFFLTVDGFYQKELPHTLMQFRTAVLELCTCLDTSRQAEFDTKAYNVRLLTPLFNSLRDIGLTLHEITLA